MDYLKIVLYLLLFYPTVYLISYLVLFLKHGNKKYSSEFMNELYNKFNEEIPTYEFKSNKYWGYYYPFLKRIYIKKLNSEEEDFTIAHEFAHYLHHKYLGNLMFYSVDAQEDFADWFAECYMENNFEIINSSSIKLQKKFSTIYPELFNYEL